jgi:hypothetical protein
MCPAVVWLNSEENKTFSVETKSLSISMTPEHPGLHMVPQPNLWRAQTELTHPSFLIPELPSHKPESYAVPFFNSQVLLSLTL